MSNPTTVWLEAELFDDLGGWTLDAQFVDQMGSPYLLAVSLGEPVADATTRVDLSEGDYRLWARAKDWAPDCSPARFQVRLNGEAAGEFGASGAQGWTWEEGGIHALGGGVEVALRDLTGEYARCDAIVLSSDPDFRPADGAEELQAQRIAHGGVSAEVDELGEYGVLVVGGGVAGCVAAVAAARMGSNTALLQNRPVLGGNASTECLVPPVGQWLYSGVDPHDPLETGIVEEFRLSGRQLPSEAKLYADRLMAVCEGEANLDLHLNMHVTDVEMASAERIAGLRALEVTTGRRVHARGKLVIDCTGDATVAAAAGAEYRHGREGRDVYDETMAPEETDDLTMGCGLKYEWEEGRQTACRRDAGGPVRQHWERGQTKYQPPEWARKFEACEDFTPTRHPLLEPEADWQWKIEIGGLQDVIADAEEIRDECLRVIYGIWD
ncbi:MAG TPA: FAD-dependent oxidoreductase, partial [Armatimonadota bacterium]|nr:FAD-dependent oxidoreductase [Armatimonadota bacterium]